MYTELEDFKTGWIGIKLALKADEIDLLVENLKFIKNNPGQHFHLVGDCQGEAGVSDIEVYVDEDATGNTIISSFAIEPNR